MPKEATENIKKIEVKIDDKPPKKKPSKKKVVEKNINEDFLQEILKAAGKDNGAQLLDSEGFAIKIRGVISTQCPSIDSALGRGGVALGRLCILHGKEGCLSGDTKISINRAGKGFSCTIKHLAEMFNGGSSGGRVWDKNIPTMIRACLDDKTIKLIKIKDCWNSGVKNVFEIKTKNNSIFATEEHKFQTTRGWIKAGKLNLGDKIFVESCKRPVRKDKEKSKPRYSSRTLSSHPYAFGKLSERFGVPYHRLKMEAALNDIHIDEFIERVKSGEDDFLFLDPSKWAVHHKDRDTNNNNINNLALMTQQAHKIGHSDLARENIAVKVHEEKVCSITRRGEREVYDIETEAPHNYIANNFVVHNSGKTTLALHIVAECQKQNGIVVYIDKEYKLDPEYATGIGVDTARLIITQPPYLEKVFEICEDIIKVGNEYRKKTGRRVPILIVLDSMNSAISKAQYEGDFEAKHVAPQSRVFSNCLPKLIPQVSQSDVCLLFISQIRKKIGIMFGDDEEIAGGNAPKFYASSIVKVTRIGSVKETKNFKSKEEKKNADIVASKIKVQVVKNQVAPPFRKAFCEIRYGEGIDRELSLVDLAMQDGIFEKTGNSYSCRGKVIGQGITQAANFLKEHPKFKEKVLCKARKGRKWD